MDEKRDSVAGELPIEDAAAEAGTDAVEQIADAVDSTEGEIDVAEAEAAAEPELAAEPESGELAEADEPEPESEPSVPEEPEAPARKPSSSASMADLVIVGILSVILGVLLCLPGMLGMTSGSEKSESASGSVAATVNGTPISEEEITNYVMDFRTQQGLDSDDAWGEWMVGYGYTAEALRADTVDYFVNRELLKQAIAEQGVEVEDSQVDEYIASITEQVGGEEAFKEALEEEGLDLDTYRSEILFSLQQQALAEKVAPAGDEVDDAQVLEIVKMYFPDSVDEKATSLDGVDGEIVEQVRSMLKSSALQQAFSQWMEDYRSNANIVVVDMPESLPYAIDLAPYEEKAKQAAQDGDLDDSDESDDAEIEEIELEEASEESASASAQSK